jgi:polyisoprenoid-binding protein YceI
MKRYARVLMVFILVFSFMNAVNSIAGSATKWDLDKAHTTINFSIKHFFTPVTGKFQDFNIDLNFDPENLSASSINVDINVASVITGNEKRDNHLLTADWFDAEKYPQMSFKSNEIVSKGDNNFVAKGKLRIKEIEKDIELAFKILGVKQIPEKMKNMLGGIDELASFEAYYSLNRKDYTVGTGSWAATLVVGGEVDIHIAVEVNRKGSPALSRQ